MSLQGFRSLLKQNLTFQLQVNICSKYLLSIKVKAYFDWAQEVGNVDGGESYIEGCPP